MARRRFCTAGEIGRAFIKNRRATNFAGGVRGRGEGANYRSAAIIERQWPRENQTRGNTFVFDPWIYNTCKLNVATIIIHTRRTFDSFMEQAATTKRTPYRWYTFVISVEIHDLTNSRDCFSTRRYDAAVPRNLRCAIFKNLTAVTNNANIPVRVRK